jgi:hypothetical protein
LGLGTFTGKVVSVAKITNSMFGTIIELNIVRNRLKLKRKILIQAGRNNNEKI